MSSEDIALNSMSEEVVAVGAWSEQDTGLDAWSDVETTPYVWIDNNATLDTSTSISSDHSNQEHLTTNTNVLAQTNGNFKQQHPITSANQSDSTKEYHQLTSTNYSPLMEMPTEIHEMIVNHLLPRSWDRPRRSIEMGYGPDYGTPNRPIHPLAILATCRQMYAVGEQLAHGSIHWAIPGVSGWRGKQSMNLETYLNAMPAPWARNMRYVHSFSINDMRNFIDLLNHDDFASSHADTAHLETSIDLTRHTANPPAFDR